MKEADALVEQMRPLLAGKSPEVQGATVAQLLAIFIASHAPPLRDSARQLLIDCADGLVPLMVEEMIAAGRAPPEWREGCKAPLPNAPVAKNRPFPALFARDHFSAPHACEIDAEIRAALSEIGDAPVGKFCPVDKSPS